MASVALGDLTEMFPVNQLLLTGFRKVECSRVIWVLTESNFYRSVTTLSGLQPVRRNLLLHFRSKRKWNASVWLEPLFQSNNIVPVSLGKFN